MLSKFQRWRRRQTLICSGASIGPGLQSFDEFFLGRASGFACGPGLYLSSGCKILVAAHDGRVGQLTIGRNVYVNHFAIIDCHYSISIGDSVLIGPHCYICDYDHGVMPDRDVGAQPEGVVGAVAIGDEVWMGANVIVLKCVTIGKGAVIGAGSVVTHDIPSMAIVAGNPARLLRMR
jgi:acetyltransferase-like isoleucine patch superfamily enzyme